MNNKHDEMTFYKERKGQSAIEYLMTYGWMLLVVAIVGGAIFATVSGQCLNDVTGFTGETAEVSDYAITEDTINVEVENYDASSIDEVAVALLDGDDVVMAGEPADGISVGSETTFPLDETQGADIQFEADDETTIDVDEDDGTNEINQVEACNDFDLEIFYATGDFDGVVQTSTGTIQGNFEPDN